MYFKIYTLIKTYNVLEQIVIIEFTLEFLVIKNVTK